MEKPIKNVTKFFIITFIQTWFFYFAIIFLSLNVFEGLGVIFLICGGMAPSLIGVIMAFNAYGKEDRKEYFRRIFQAKRIGARWWCFILLIFPAVHALASLIMLISGGDMPTMEGLRDAVQSPSTILITLLLGFFFNGAFPEELGWRGFALEPLLNRFGFIKANLFLGVIWCVWHLPLFFMHGQFHNHLGPVGFWFFLADTIGLSMIMGLVFIKTKCSTFSALLLHMLFNLTSNMTFSYSETYYRTTCLIVFAIGIIICIYMNVSEKSALRKRNDKARQFI